MPLRFLTGAARKGLPTHAQRALLPLLVLAASSGTALPASADQIIAGNVNHTDVTIVSLDGGRLLFQTPGGEERSIWLSDVNRLTVNAVGMFLDFNQAERYLADNDPARAIVRYRRTLRRSEGMWTDLVAARLVTACNRADRIDQAALHLVRVDRGRWAGPALAARLIPGSVPTDRARTAAAIQYLEEAIDAASSLETRIPLQLCYYEILRNTGHERASEAARTLASLDIPEAIRCERVYEILLSALTQRLDEQVDADALSGLNRAILYCPEEFLPSFLLLKGHALLRSAATREDYIRAAWPFLRVAIHMPRDPRAADGLHGAALAVERSGSTDKAIALLSECLAHKRVGEQTRHLAEEALARLRALENVP